MKRKNLLFLVGFMGAGKSTIGPLLARELNWDFIDMDQAIEISEGRPITQIFLEKGEAYFRRLESQKIQDLRTKKSCVIALGGGAFIQESNRLLIQDIGFSVFLDCALNVILERCPNDGTRPLFLSLEKVEALHAARLPYYHMSDFRVDVTNQTPERIVETILAHLEFGIFGDAR
jgi:shikimate kinase